MTFWSTTLRLVITRARAAPILVGLRLVGVLVAVALVCAVSLYAGTMADALLWASLSPSGQDVLVTINASPGNPALLPYPAFSQLDGYLRHGAAGDLGLPVRTVSGHFSLANPWPLTAWGQNGGASSTSYGSADLEYFDNVARHMRVLAGALPASTRMPDGSVPVAVSRTTADAEGLHVGQRLGLVIQDLATGAQAPPLTVAAVFTPTSAADPIWQASSPSVMAQPYEVLSPRAFVDLAQLSPSSNPQYSWDLSLPVRGVHFASADVIRASVARFTAIVTRQAPGTTVFTLLVGTLTAFAHTFALLNVLLYLLAAPVVLIVLYYMVVSTELVVDRQVGEIVLLRSRGATTGQILRTYAVEGAAMGIVAVVAGPLLAIPVAYKIGQTSGFLSFADSPSPVGAPTAVTFLAGAVVAVLAVVAGLLPTLGAVRRTMSSYKREQVRSRYNPLWQRVYLDVALLAVALYGYWVLVRQGPILPSQNQSAVVHDPFVAVAPALFVLAGTLLLGRLLPLLSTAVAKLLRRSAVPLSMAVQTIARTPRPYMRLAMLLGLTLSIGVFAAAVAGTIGANQHDQYHYQAGASLRLVEDDLALDQYLALPLAWHLRQKGVYAATPALRLESYQCDVAAGAFSSPIEVLGVDLASFARVAWWRPDFAGKPLTALLATLTSTTAPRVLINDAVVQASQVHVGDQIQLSITGNQPILATVVGVVHYFPTMNPTEGYYAIMNLPLLEQLSSAPGPSEVWMATDGSSAVAQNIIAAVQRTGRVVVDYEDHAPPLTIVDNPLQVGIYGVSSIGFIIAAGLSMLGLVAYLYLSLERRAADFGVLRALGSSTVQVAAMLLLEQLFLVVVGVLAALAIGLAGGQLFIPYLPIAQFTTPPFLVAVPWQDVVRLVAILLAAFAVALAVSAYAITRIQISRVLRLGEAV